MGPDALLMHAHAHAHAHRMPTVLPCTAGAVAERRFPAGCRGANALAADVLSGPRVSVWPRHLSEMPPLFTTRTGWSSGREACRSFVSLHDRPNRAALPRAAGTEPQRTSAGFACPPTVKVSPRPPRLPLCWLPASLFPKPVLVLGRAGLTFPAQNNQSHHPHGPAMGLGTNVSPTGTVGVLPAHWEGPGLSWLLGWPQAELRMGRGTEPDPAWPTALPQAGSAAVHPGPQGP